MILCKRNPNLQKYQKSMRYCSMNVFCKLSLHLIIWNEMRGTRSALGKQIFKRVQIRLSYSTTLSYYLDILPTMPYPSRADSSPSVRPIASYAAIENGSKHRRLKPRQVFNNIMTDENINPLSSSPDPLHGPNPPSSSPDPLIQPIPSRGRYLQDITFAVNGSPSFQGRMHQAISKIIAARIGPQSSVRLPILPTP